MRHAARTFGLLVVFLAALVGGALLHVNTPAAQRAIVQRINGVLEPLFSGRLTIVRVGGLGARGVAQADAKVEDRDGQLVIDGSGVTASLSTAALVASILGRGDIVVDIPSVTVDSARVVLDADTAQDFRIAKAFAPRKPSAPGGPPGRGVRVAIHEIHIRHATVKGRPPGLPAIDASVDDTSGTLLLADDKLTVDATAARWQGRGVPGLPDAPAHGGARVHLAVPSESGRAVGLRVSTQAFLGEVPVAGDVTYDGGDLDARADIAEAPPEAVRAIVPGWPLQRPVHVYAEAKGSVAGEGRLATKAHAVSGKTVADFVGPITLAPLTATLHADVRGLDLSAFAPSAPASDLAATGAVTATLQASGALGARAVLDVSPGNVGAAETPAVGVTADFARAASPSDAMTATVHAAVREPGAPTVVNLRLLPSRGDLRVAFEVETNAPDLAGAPILKSLGVPMRGRALVHVDGTADLLRSTIDAVVSASAESLGIAGVTAGTAHADVHATGPMANPALVGQVSGTDVGVAGLECSSLSGRARMSFGDGLALNDVDVSARSGEEHARLQAKLVRVAGGAVDVQDAVMHGFGAPVEATARVSPGRLSLRARTGELDLDRIARFFGIGVVQGGRVSMDVDADVTRETGEGRVNVDVAKGAFAGLRDVDAHVELTLHGKEAQGVVTAQVADIGSLDVRSTTVHIGDAGPLVLSSWRRAWGAVDVKAQVALSKLLAALPAGTLPLKQMQGSLALTARLARDSPSDATPGVDATLATTGLVLVGAAGAQTWRLEGLDPAVHVTVDDKTGATALVAAIHDTTGPVVEMSATSNDVPYARVFSGEPLAAAFEAAPFEAHFDVPGRKLQDLPASLGLGDLRGELQANVDWHGAATSPSVDVSATLARGRVDPAASSLPVDLTLDAKYDGAKAIAHVQAVNKDKVVADASVSASVRAADLLAGIGGAPVPWTASANAKLDALPLRSFTALSDRNVRGRVSGTLTIDRLHDDASAFGTLVFDGLNVGEVACKSSAAMLRVDGHQLNAVVRLDQNDAEKGFLELHAKAATHWGKALVPSIDEAQPGEITLAAQKFRAALLYPFVSGVFASLDGRIDAAASITVDPGGGGAHPQGTIKLSDGSFEMTTLGGEFADVSAEVDLKPSGEITLKNAVAYGVTGKLEVGGGAQLTGFAFGGAHAVVTIPKDQAVPVVFDGVQMGMLDGNCAIAVGLSPAHDELDVNVAVPAMHMALPASGSHDVQSLGDLEDVTTGVLRGSAGFVDIPLDTVVDTTAGASSRLPIKLSVSLQQNVEVTRGDDLDVRISGQPIVTIADQVRVTGQIRVTRGTLDVNGKPFEIENGTITFSGDDPSNPQVVLTAMWTAEDEQKTRIYADFTGPLKTGTVKLRSDPQLPGGENDIRALLLFGTVESDTTVGQNAAPVAGAAGGVATQGINRALSPVNRALDKIGLAGGISTRIDTSQANPRPEVEIGIARDISLQISYVLGVPVPGANPDNYYATLDWRFLRAWSLEATRGDAGTSILDLIWQHRY
ncbi:MAG TPA: translocation/assembly module TamB domain-containing protein [Polyangiaceae bacterium]|jgi:translocation and assembly module TamB|nr:translocation/assembly module TamB domain-containing protein [Polyangiaceae bacterium]